MADAPKFHRISGLDSIRGIAAFVVVLHHCSLMYFSPPEAGYLNFALLSFHNAFLYALRKIFEAGHASVIIFFTLSGFVLAYSLLKKNTGYLSYATKRFFRIYPAFLVVILLTYVFHKIIGVRFFDESNLIMPNILDPDLSFTTLSKNLLMWKSYKIDPVIWSLMQEMRISLVFPFILLTIRKFDFKAVIAYSIVSLSAAAVVFILDDHVIRGFTEPETLESFLASAYFIFFFVIGAYLAIHREYFQKFLSGLAWYKIFALLLIATALLLKSDYGDKSFMSHFVDYGRGIASLILIALAMAGGTISFILNHKIPIWLGRISYSLYLIHLPVLYVISQTIGLSWSKFELSVATVFISLLLSELLARTVEFPAIGLGKKVAARFLPDDRTEAV